MEKSTEVTLQRAEAEFAADGGLEALAEQLYNVSLDCADWKADESAGDDDDTGIDVRLRYHRGRFYVYDGDPCYDQDHRGYWGAASVWCDMSPDDAREVAEDLLDQVLDDIAMSRDN